MPPVEDQSAILQAVLVVDDFDGHFSLFTQHRSKGFLTVVNRPVIDFSLRFLETNSVHEVFVFVGPFHDEIRRYVKDTWSNSNMVVHVVESVSSSLGDVLRDVDRKGKIKSDFILMRGDAVASFSLAPILDAHKSRRSKDKGCIMTLAMVQGDKNGDIILANNRDNKILFFAHDNNRQSVKFPLRIFKENTTVQLSKRLRDSQIAVCAPNLLLLFTDNVDYQTTEDFIRGTIDNEDILGNSIHFNLIKGYSSRIVDARTYHETSQAILSRWSHPFVPDKMGRVSFNHNNIFVDKSCGDVSLRDCHIDRNSAIACNSSFGSNVSVSRCVIGKNCKIGSNVVLSNCYIWDNVIIEDNCTISHSIIDEKTIVRKGCTIQSCLIGQSVKVGQNTKLASSEVRRLDGKSDDILGKDGSGHVTNIDISPEDEWPSILKVPDDVASASSDSEKEDMEFGGEEDYVTSFYAEVVDNFKRGIVECISCDNLVLEVNSMKHAYNIPINEVNTLVIQGAIEVASLPDILPGNHNKVLQVYQQLLPLIKNYIRDANSQMDCALALEEYHLHHKDFLPSLLVKVLKFLYDSDVLEEEVICEWFSDEGRDLPSLLLKDGGSFEKERKTLRKDPLLRQFIQWLEEAEEETSDSE